MKLKHLLLFAAVTGGLIFLSSALSSCSDKNCPAYKTKVKSREHKSPFASRGGRGRKRPKGLFH